MYNIDARPVCYLVHSKLRIDELLTVTKIQVEAFKLDLHNLFKADPC